MIRSGRYIQNVDSVDLHLEWTKLQPRSPFPQSLQALARAMLLQAWVDWWGNKNPPLSIVDQVLLKAWVRGAYENGKPYRCEAGFNFDDICQICGLDPVATKQRFVTSRPPVWPSSRKIIRVSYMTHIAQPRPKPERKSFARPRKVPKLAANGN